MKKIKNRHFLLVLISCLCLTAVAAFAACRPKDGSGEDSKNSESGESSKNSGSGEGSKDSGKSEGSKNSGSNESSENSGSSEINKSNENDSENTDSTGSSANASSESTDDTSEKNLLLADEVENSAAGTVFEADRVDFSDVPRYTVVSEISDAVFQRINGKSYRENPDIDVSMLRYLKLLHYNFDGKVQVGELIVNAEIADQTARVFDNLLENKYEIYSMHLVDDFWTGDAGSTDDASMLANNSSAFNYRTIYNTDKLSNHARGYAIDINPAQNPYVYYTEDGFEKPYDFDETYLDRTSGLPHVIVNGDICYHSFVNEGFSWGGDWDNPKDFQHFEHESAEN